MSTLPISLHLRPEHPAFRDLPWGSPLAQWGQDCSRVVQLARGISRHTVVFVQYNERVYALKELGDGQAQREYRLLKELESAQLPVVTPVGHGRWDEGREVLITQFLATSLPYHRLFQRGSLERYGEYLLDAMAGLLVQLHVKGVYWGDCSLSNTLFRRDAGRLQAYLVDAETAEILPEMSDYRRSHELDVMEENLWGELSDLIAAGLVNPQFPLAETTAQIKCKYLSLWETVHAATLIPSTERYRIRERIGMINDLGFSVNEVEIQRADQGDRIRFNVGVTDRNYHRNKLFGMTGLHAQENQARAMINDILEFRVNSGTPDDLAPVVAFRWLNEVYLPVVQRLLGELGSPLEGPELFMEFLKRKWILSEQAGCDVGRDTTLEDLIANPPSLDPPVRQH